MSYLASNIRKLRKAKRLSQTQFAKLFSLTRASVGAYEEGRAEPKLDKLIEIAKYFGLTLDQLVARKLSINEIFHYDEKVKTISEKIPFVPYTLKDQFIKALTNQQKIDLPNIILPSVQADIAFEVIEFPGLKNAIVFGQKTPKPRHNSWHITIVDNDYHLFYNNSQNLNLNQLWSICCIFTKDIQNIGTQNNHLIRIEQKLDYLLNLHKSHE